MITSTANEAVRAARKLASRAGRRRSAAFLVEGPQAVREAVPWLQQLFVTRAARSRHAQIVGAAMTAGTVVIDVSEAVLRSISDAVTPQGIIGVARLPAAQLQPTLHDARLIVGLFEISDPGNAGTAIRTADAVGADAVVLTRGSIDIRNPKAVRSSAGSLFHFPVVVDVDPGLLVEVARRESLQLVAASAAGTAELADVDLTQPSLLLFGNEAHGLPDALLQRSDVTARVALHSVPRPGYQGTAESLNLAATVAMFLYEAARQRRRVSAR